MLFIVEYVETIYVYTLEYVYIYRIYVYMYLYVNKESLLNLSLTCGKLYFFHQYHFVSLCTKTQILLHITEYFSQLEFVL